MSNLDFYRDLGAEVIEEDYGWLNYYINGEDCYLENMHIEKSFRGKGYAQGFAADLEDIARLKGCKNITTTINTKREGVERSMKAILKHGFKFLDAGNGWLSFYKEL